MRLDKKIILDRLLAKPLAIILNLIVWSLGKIISIDHDDSPRKVRVIVIQKLLGMGSILRATPLVRTLKHRYPQARYVLITTLKNKSLVESLPLFDAYLYIRDSSLFSLFIDTCVLIVKLWRYKIDLYFDLEVYSAFSTILATLSLARNRYGFYRESTRFRIGLNTHLVFFNDHQHISKIYLQLAKACGIKESDLDYTIEKINIEPKDREELMGWYNILDLKSNVPYIVINPNASDLLLERRWPLDYFAVLINALALSWRGYIFLLGSPQEYAYNSILHEALSQEAKKITFNCAGKISLKASIVLISKARLMVTNDSGLYHIGGVFDIPVISLWGPGTPEHYADRNNTADFTFYSHDIYCSPCLYKTDFPPCRGNNVCMKSIAPKKVYIKVCEVLKIIPLTDISFLVKTSGKENIKDLDITIRRPDRT